MGDNLSTVAGINASAQLLGSSIDAYSVAQTNKKQRKFAEHMYDRQRSDALADWTMQTEYNSPVSQMQRLRDANLNPNLVYGDSVVQSAPAVRSSSAPAWNPRAPEPGKGVEGIGQSLAQMYSLKLMEAQTNNVKQATTTGMEDAALKRAQMFATIAGTGKTTAETEEIMVRLSNAQSLSDISVDAAKVGVEKQKAEIYTMLSANERAAISQTQNLKESVQRVLTLRAEAAKTDAERDQIRAKIDMMGTEQLGNELENRIKQENLKLMQQGIQPHDPLWQRRVSQLVDEVLSIPGKVWDFRKNLTPSHFFGKENP